MNILGDQKKHTDQKKAGQINTKGQQKSMIDISRLNSCCLFCNNKILYKAVKQGDIP